MIVFKEIKVRYDHLDIILDEKLKDIRFKNDITVIVDLKEILKKVFRPDILNDDEILGVVDSPDDVLNASLHS